MANPEVIELLQEIRDLQKMHVENYKDALKNQRESIEMQRKTSRRANISMLILLIIVALAMAITVAPSLIRR